MLSLAVALIVTLALLWPLRRVALHFGILDDPGPRKIHTQPVPYLGGLAMLGGLAAAMLWLRPELRAVVVLITLVTAVGLVDDIRYLPVWVKLIGQVTVA